MIDHDHDHDRDDAIPLPTTEELVACPPTELASELLRAAVNGSQECPEDSPGRARLVAEADRATRAYRLALRRDHQLARRRALGPDYEGCVCLGQGGCGSRLLVGRRPDPESVAEAVLVTDAEGAPIQTWEVVCPCPDGRAVADRIGPAVRADEERRRRARVARILGEAGIPASHARRTRRGWAEAIRQQPRSREERIEGALAVIAGWEEVMADPEGDDRCVLLLVGEVGTGKSSLAGSVALAWADRGRSVLYRATPTLALALRSAPLYRRSPEDPPTPTATELVQALLDVELLVLDDLGAEAPGSEREGDRLREWLFAAVVGRVELGRPTVVTTNLSRREAVERYDRRLAERLFSEAHAALVTFGPDQGLPSLRPNKTGPFDPS